MYPVRRMIPVAMQVLKTRNILFHGVSALLTLFPVMACKFCPEVYIGEEGHLIRTCPGPGRRHGSKKKKKRRVHEWARGGLEDILVPVETFRLPTTARPPVVKHERRFDLDRVPAVLELCRRAGAEVEPEPEAEDGGARPLSPGEEAEGVSSRTLRAWEEMRGGVGRLLRAHPAKVCRYCWEVHLGPAKGNRVRLCGVFRTERWRGAHMWGRAEVDHLVPPRMVWRRRPHDPPVLLDHHRGFYGCAPAVVDLCTRGGAVAPPKYFCMMKLQGFSPAPAPGEPGPPNWARGFL